MALGSGIEWTEATWNPVTGCTKVSPGCAHCYAERMARRLKAMGHANYARGFELAVHEGMLEIPLGWTSPRLVFVNSMSDLFHEQVPVEFIQRVFDAMRRAHWHTFQILTKRSRRLRELDHLIDWPTNVWMGVSVETARYQERVADLRETGACVKFVSYEPLLGPVGRTDLIDIDWVIVGGESGPGARPMRAEWAVQVRDQCLQAGVPFFFKQWGGTNKKRAGRVLQGRVWDQMPAAFATAP